MSEELPILNDEQKGLIDQNLATMDIGSITRLVFKNETLDGRTNEGKAVKQYLASKGQTVKTSQKIVKGELELTDPQKLFIQTNHQSMKPLEMAKLLFPHKVINTLLTAEGRAVYKYTQEISKDGVDFWDEPADSKEYRPPKTIQAVLGLANEYVTNKIDPTKSAYDFNGLKPFEIKCLKALQSYLKTTRVRYQAGLYDKKADRILFESSIVRMIHDKPDLSEADVDMYVAAASELVNITREERKILRLEDELDQILSGETDAKQRLSTPFVELINQTRTKWDASKKRYQDIMSDLESTRSKRDEHRIKQNQSILSLLDAWIKDEQTRNDIIAFGEKEKDEDRNEVQRLEKFDNIVALIAGQTRDEASL